MYSLQVVSTYSFFTMGKNHASDTILFKTEDKDLQGIVETIIVQSVFDRVCKSTLYISIRLLIENTCDATTDAMMRVEVWN